MASTAQSDTGAAVGCVVIGRNEGERLIRCLRSLDQFGGPVVYVDSGSSDGSVEAARKLGAIVVELDLQVPFTAARARNEGFAALKLAMPDAGLIQFVDGDCEVAPGWLEKARASLAEKPQAAVVCGRRRERHPQTSIYNHLCDLEWDTPIGEAAACGGDALMRTEAFEAAGGFQSRLMAGEEPELCARIRDRGWKVLRIDAEMTLHDAAMTRFGQWWRRGIRSGFGYAQVWNATRHSADTLYGQELKRALFWAGIVPLLIVAALFIYPLAAVAIAALYPLQIGRIALRRGIAEPASWAYASLMVIGKFAELQGAADYFMKPGRARGLIEYKSR